MSTPDVAKLWEKSTRHLQKVLRPDVFQRWIAVIEPVSATDTVLTLAVDNDFYQTWLEEHYLPLIIDAVAAMSGSRFEIEFCIRKTAHVPIPEPAQPKRKSLRQRLTKRARTLHPFNEKFTFDDFIVGPCNSFAHAASLAVAQAPARAYNPLFIYGGTGLGKTHLMQGVGHYVQTNSRSTVSYLSCEKFTNEYIDALQSRSLVAFRKRYRNVDLLLIDDIHFLAGKEALQEEFFHTFNTLFDAHKQIVMTSDRPASEIVGLEQRLVSRFEWGLVTEMEPPDFETRMAILRNRLMKSDVTLSDEIVTFLAENIRSNVRRLEGALIRVISYVSLTGNHVTLDSLQRLLRDTIDEEQIEALSFTAIQKAVAQHYDVRIADIMSKRRPQAIALPRQIAMYLCRRMTSASLPEIGTAFGKTHATVLHACRSIEKKIDADPSLKRNLNTIATSLGKSL